MDIKRVIGRKKICGTAISMQKVEYMNGKIDFQVLKNGELVAYDMGLEESYKVALIQSGLLENEKLVIE